MVREPPRNLLLYWHTLKWLRPTQWRCRIRNAVQFLYYRRLPAHVRQSLLKRVPAKITYRPVDEHVTWLERTHGSTHGMFRAEDILKGRFTFLNRSKQFESLVAWRNPEFTYLWDFNLHYFEYLESIASVQDVSSEQVVRFLIHSWIDGNPCPVQPAWHPYPTSLRTINWVKLLVNRPQFAEECVLQSLYSQFLFLERNLELHLLANHLLENGRSLLFGGLFFDGKDAQRWFRIGSRLLRQELEEEYLPLGGHFERSPMYHCILLEGLLDTYAYLAKTGHDPEWLFRPLLKMCEWLQNIRCPDDTIPLFNDAAIGIAATPDEILSHAERLLGFVRRSELPAVRDCDKVFVFDSSPLYCAIDGAPIGPSYNPGHAHSDNFTYELFLSGGRCVVDAGTHSYEVDANRLASRSTAAHNTVVINGLEQSEVWGSFRVGRRSNPTLSRAGRCGGCLVFQGKYTNRLDPAQGITHERIIAMKPSLWMLVFDTIQARGMVDARSYCHLAPGWRIAGIPNGYRIDHAEHSNIRCYPIRVDTASVFESQYAPEFGKAVSVQALSFFASGRRFIETGYLLAVAELVDDGCIQVVREVNSLSIRIGQAEEQIDLGELDQ